MGRAVEGARCARVSKVHTCSGASKAHAGCLLGSGVAVLGSTLWGSGLRVQCRRRSLPQNQLQTAEPVTFRRGLKL